MLGRPLRPFTYSSFFLSFLSDVLEIFSFLLSLKLHVRLSFVRSDFLLYVDVIQDFISLLMCFLMTILVSTILLCDRAIFLLLKG